MKKLFIILSFTSFSYASQIDLSPVSTSFDYAQVIQATAAKSPDGSWCFTTKVHHNDESWEHYATAWEIIDFSGNQLGQRVLKHPHIEKQPFTRKECGIQIPKELSKVVVRARCNKHSFGGKSVVVDLTIP